MASLTRPRHQRIPHIDDCILHATGAPKRNDNFLPSGVFDNVTVGILARVTNGKFLSETERTSAVVLVSRLGEAHSAVELIVVFLGDCALLKLRRSGGSDGGKCKERREEDGGKLHGKDCDGKSELAESNSKEGSMSGCPAQAEGF